MNSLPHAERRTDAGAGPKVTYAHRQPRPADPDLANLDRRIAALADRGRLEPERACRVVLLRRKHGWLVRDRAAGGALWATDARNLLWAIECEEAVPNG